MKTKKREKYLIISDLHVPDYDIKALDLVLRFIPHYQPDCIDLLGDFINFTKISKYDQDPYYKTDLADEIEEGRGVLKHIVSVARKVNPNVEINYFEGNHEARLSKYLGRNANQLADLTADDEYIVSIPHLFELKKLGVKWIRGDKVVQRHGVTFFHGAAIRVKSGFSAHANIDKFGTSGFTGHTHRLAHITRTQSRVTKFWIETGCLCNRTPTPSYAVSPDWCQGFATAEYSPITRQFYPQVIPIIDHSFIYDSKIFT